MFLFAVRQLFEYSCHSAEMFYNTNNPEVGFVNVFVTRILEVGLTVQFFLARNRYSLMNFYEVLVMV